MSKFVGKFRKNKNYTDDYDFSPRQRKKESHGEFKKMKNMKYEDFISDYEEKGKLPQRSKHH